MASVEVDGRDIGYDRAGSGPPLLLLHGGWSDGREWRPQVEGLSDEFDVIAWDAPGCGRSDDPPEGIDLDGYAAVVTGFVTALGLDRVHLCGHSFGGGLALAVYRRRPALVRSLVLAAAYAGWQGSLPEAEARERVRKVTAELRRPPAEWVEDYLPGLFAGPVEPAVLQEVRSVMLEVRPAGTAAMLSAFAAADLRPVLPTIAVPALVLHGTADVRAPRHVAEALHAAIPGSTLVPLPGVGHAMNIEAPAAFGAAVRAFLRTVSGSPFRAG